MSAKNKAEGYGHRGHGWVGAGFQTLRWSERPQGHMPRPWGEDPLAWQPHVAPPHSETPSLPPPRHCRPTRIGWGSEDSDRRLHQALQLRALQAGRSHHSGISHVSTKCSETRGTDCSLLFRREARTQGKRAGGLPAQKQGKDAEATGCGQGHGRLARRCPPSARGGSPRGGPSVSRMTMAWTTRMCMVAVSPLLQRRKTWS